MHPPRPSRTLDQHYAEIVTRLEFANAADIAWESRARAHADLKAKLVAAKQSMEGKPNEYTHAAIHVARKSADMLNDRGPLATLGGLVRGHLDGARVLRDMGNREAAGRKVDQAIATHKEYMDREFANRVTSASISNQLRTSHG